MRKDQASSILNSSGNCKLDHLSPLNHSTPNTTLLPEDSWNFRSDPFDFNFDITNVTVSPGRPYHRRNTTCHFDVPPIDEEKNAEGASGMGGSWSGGDCRDQAEDSGLGQNKLHESHGSDSGRDSAAEDEVVPYKISGIYESDDQFIWIDEFAMSPSVIVRNYKGVEDKINSDVVPIIVVNRVTTFSRLWQNRRKIFASIFKTFLLLLSLFIGLDHIRYSVECELEMQEIEQAICITDNSTIVPPVSLPVSLDFPLIVVPQVPSVTPEVEALEREIELLHAKVRKLRVLKTEQNKRIAGHIAGIRGEVEQLREYHRNKLIPNFIMLIMITFLSGCALGMAIQMHHQCCTQKVTATVEPIKEKKKKVKVIFFSP